MFFEVYIRKWRKCCPLLDQRVMASTNDSQLIDSGDDFSLKVVEETSVSVTTNKPSQDYTHLHDHTLPTYNTFSRDFFCVGKFFSTCFSKIVKWKFRENVSFNNKLYQPTDSTILNLISTSVIDSLIKKHKKTTKKQKKKTKKQQSYWVVLSHGSNSAYLNS